MKIGEEIRLVYKMHVMLSYTPKFSSSKIKKKDNIISWITHSVIEIETNS